MAYDDRFWNSESGDRIYDAEEWDYYAESIASDGYVPDSAHLNGGLWVRQADPADMSVNVDTGHMWINGKHFRVHTSAENLAVAAADSSNDRIDRAIVRVNRTNRVVFPTVKTGTAGTSPSPPSLQQDSSIWELSLAQIYVAAGVTSVSDTDITDERTPSHSMPEPAEHGGPSHDGSVADNPHGHGQHSILAEEYVAHLSDGQYAESAGPDSYPLGLSLMMVGSAWSSLLDGSAIITTERVRDNDHAVQYMHEVSMNRYSYWRVRSTSTSWTNWRRFIPDGEFNDHSARHEPFGADYVSYRLANDAVSIDAAPTNWPDGRTLMYVGGSASNPGGADGTVIAERSGAAMLQWFFEHGETTNRVWVRSWNDAAAAWLSWRELVDTVSITQIGENVIGLDTDYTLALSDAGLVVVMRPDTMDVTLTVPANGSVAFPIGTVIEVSQFGSGGTVTIAPATGVDIRSPYGQTGSRQIFGNYASATLRKRNTDQWMLGGDLD